MTLEVPAAERRRWLRPEQLDGLFELPAPVGTMGDLKGLESDLDDPFERWDPRGR